jgi:voltage-gated potassium channel Kch
VLHAVGGDKAACAVITLDTPGANYRTVWALQKSFPGLKTFVRAHDIEHGLNLEKAGATAVVPETLEPSLQVSLYISPRHTQCLHMSSDQVRNMGGGNQRKILAMERRKSG